MAQWCSCCVLNSGSGDVTFELHSGTIFICEIFVHTRLYKAWADKRVPVSAFNFWLSVDLVKYVCYEFRISGCESVVNALYYTLVLGRSSGLFLSTFYSYIICLCNCFKNSHRTLSYWARIMFKLGFPVRLLMSRLCPHDQTELVWSSTLRSFEVSNLRLHCNLWALYHHQRQD